MAKNSKFTRAFYFKITENLQIMSRDVKFTLLFVLKSISYTQILYISVSYIHIVMLNFLNNFCIN